MDCLRQSCRAGVRSVEVRKDVVREFQRSVDALFKGKVMTSPCSAWFKDKHGRPSNVWPATMVYYWWLTRKADLMRDFRIVMREKRS